MWRLNRTPVREWTLGWQGQNEPWGQWQEKPLHLKGGPAALAGWWVGGMDLGEGRTGGSCVCWVESWREGGVVLAGIPACGMSGQRRGECSGGQGWGLRGQVRPRERGGLSASLAAEVEQGPTLDPCIWSSPNRVGLGGAHVAGSTDGLSALATYKELVLASGQGHGHPGSVLYVNVNTNWLPFTLPGPRVCLSLPHSAFLSSFSRLSRPPLRPLPPASWAFPAHCPPFTLLLWGHCVRGPVSSPCCKRSAK